MIADVTLVKAKALQACTEQDLDKDITQKHFLDVHCYTENFYRHHHISSLTVN